MGSQQFCLRWNNHQPNMLDVFGGLLANECLVDVTLACEGASLKAHKVILSACSPFFQEIFLNNPCKHPVVIMKDMCFDDLKSVINFMYHGEVNISQDRLSSLLKCAESLKIKGLAEMSAENHHQMKLNASLEDRLNSTPCKMNSTAPVKVSSPLTSPMPKRRRGRPSKVYALQNNIDITNDISKELPPVAPSESNETSSVHHSEASFPDSLDDEIDDSVSNDHSMELTEQEKQSLDLLTVDDSQMIVPKIERDDMEPYDEEYLDITHDSSFESQFDENYTETGSTSQLHYDNADLDQNSSSDKKKSSGKQGDGRPRRKRRLWTDTDMQSAVGAVLHGGWTTYAASSQFGIPRRTLRYYIEKVKMS